MSVYELAVVTSDELPEKDKKEIFEKIEKKISDSKGTLTNTEEWPKRKLAYPIKKNTNAIFTFVQFEVDSKVPAEIRKELNISESVLRSLLIKKTIAKIGNGKAVKKKEPKED